MEKYGASGLLLSDSCLIILDAATPTCFQVNTIDWAAFEILNIGNPKIDGVLPVNVRVIDGLFQAFAVRSGGFFVVTISDLRISLQVLYVVMMYISVYPVVMYASLLSFPRILLGNLAFARNPLLN